MKKFLLIGLLLAVSFSSSGCAVILAAKQPGKVDEKVLNYGMPRDSVLAELGAPINTETKEGKRVDIYQYEQGFSIGTKVFRCAFHATADFFTFFLWELIATPAETMWSGEKKATRVTYDATDKVETVLFLKK
jgi:hypothetical protein